MTYSLVNRKIPKGVKPIRFHFKDDLNFGMLNLCCWKDEINNIKNYNRKVINNSKIKIYYPITSNYFYIKEYSSTNGFTFKQLIDRIVKAGIQAGRYYIKINPEYYPKNMTNMDFIGEYSIASSNKNENIYIKGNKVYINLEH